MFTGIITSVGRVRAVSPRLVIEAPEAAARLAVGGSVAVNGACLTAVAVAPPTFELEVVDETLRRTNLGALQPGAQVNLELPLVAGAPLDGHLVQGHVDGVGSVREVSEAAVGREIAIELPGELARFVVEKGSVAVDGTSLTVTAVDEGAFSIALIPHTLQHTIAGNYRPGTSVNLEVDVLARHVERLVRLGIGRR